MPSANLNSRQKEILELARRQGFVSIDKLAADFDVTSQTVRRDINRMCNAGLMQRFHGGASLSSSVENLAYDTRLVMQAAEKAAIALEVVRHVPDRASLFINIGTTTESVARALSRRTGLRIITNNLNVANILGGNSGFEVIVAGGTVRSRDMAIVGEATIDFVNHFRVDIAIIGISGIDRDGSLLDFDFREVRVAQAIIANARKVFLCADHTKFGRGAMVRMGHLGDVDVLFTDRSPPAYMSKALNAAEIEVHLPGQGVAGGQP